MASIGLSICRRAGLSERDTVLCLMSGGGSALWPAPAEGITLGEKQQVTSLLLRAGAGIRELNAVRKHLSAVKGGQLARWAAPAQVVSLIMSDVIGDPLDFIASGPAAPDTTTFADALEIIQKYGVDVPIAVMNRLHAGSRGEIPDTPKPGDSLFDRVHNQIIANTRLLVEAAARQAKSDGFKTLILSTEVEGEARDRPAFPQIAHPLYYDGIAPRLAAATQQALGAATSPQEWNTYLLASPDFMHR